MVAFEVFGGVMEFSINGFVGFFEDGGSGRFCALVMGLDILNEEGEALRAIAEFFGGGGSGLQVVDHDPRVARAHLCSADRIAVAEMFCEAEGAGEPGDGFLKVAVVDVRNHGIRGNGAVGDQAMFPLRGSEWELLPLLTIENGRGHVL